MNRLIRKCRRHSLRHRSFELYFAVWILWHGSCGAAERRKAGRRGKDPGSCFRLLRAEPGKLSPAPAGRTRGLPGPQEGSSGRSGSPPGGQGFAVKRSGRASSAVRFLLTKTSGQSDGRKEDRRRLVPGKRRKPTSERQCLGRAALPSPGRAAAPQPEKRTPVEVRKLFPVYAGGQGGLWFCHRRSLPSFFAWFSLPGEIVPLKQK